jgi:hypothetical protein
MARERGHLLRKGAPHASACFATLIRKYSQPHPNEGRNPQGPAFGLFGLRESRAPPPSPSEQARTAAVRACSPVRTPSRTHRSTPKRPDRKPPATGVADCPIEPNLPALAAAGGYPDRARRRGLSHPPARLAAPCRSRGHQRSFGRNQAGDARCAGGVTSVGRNDPVHPGDEWNEGE